jgi:hypothetical protein
LRPLRHYAGPAAVAAAAGAVLFIVLWIDLGPIHRGENADSLLTVLISCQKWTPFYWEQNRVGMLAALLAIPFRDPFVNLLVQRAITWFLVLGSFFAVMRYVVGRRLWLPGGAAAIIIFLLAWHRGPVFYQMLATGMYGIPLAFGFATLGLLAAEPSGRFTWRTWVGACLFLVAMWANIGIALSLGPIILAGRWLVPEMKGKSGPRPTSLRSLLVKEAQGKAGRAAIVFGGAFVIAAVFSQFIGMRTPWNRSSHIGEWANSWVMLLQNSWRSSFARSHLLAAILITVAVGVLTVVFRSGRAALPKSIRPAGCLLIGAIAHWLLMGMSKWVVMNDHDDRYMYLPLMLVICAAVAFTISQVAAVLRERSFVPLTVPALIALWLVPLLLPGSPSVKGVRADLDALCGRYTDELIESGCTHFIGDYWTVWPAVFHANMTLHEQGSMRHIWGLSYRCEDTRKHWSRIPLDEWRVGSAVGEEEVTQRWIAKYDLPTLEEDQLLNTIKTYRVDQSTAQR